MNNFNRQTHPRLFHLLDTEQQELLRGGLKGIEKESLRISTQGMIAQTAHPKVLGSALMHPFITTDYSEALLEFITPPFAEADAMLEFMRQIHQFVYPNIGDELLLSTSMPCGIDGDLSIPIAEYGSSNIAKMKHIYRKGLWHRYGRSMQSIAGIHFNYSVPEKLWPALFAQQSEITDLAAFINHSYFGLVRNFQKTGWLILYLFGASPAICKSFFGSRPHLMAQFEEFDNGSLYHPYATSLRMSDIGYKSKNQENLKIDYNSLAGYVETLTQAISTPYPEYEKIGIKDGAEYKQLNCNILQIENEFYSTMRPKQIIASGEKPTLALKRRGVRYVELRSLDLNLFSPVGIELSTTYFLEAFLLNCLLQESPLHQGQEVQINNQNQLKVAHAGRQPGLVLNNHQGEITLKAWANDILAAMQPVCAVLDAGNPAKPYSTALELQQALVDNPELTPSARILADMRNDQQCFGQYALAQSKKHQAYFKSTNLDPKLGQDFQKMAEVSWEQQSALEQQDALDFDSFLAQYFSQH